MDTLYLVIPCYNEQEVLPETAKRLSWKIEDLRKAGLVSDESRILFVDDGSHDRTWEIIAGLHKQDARFCGVKLSRNEGHQNALLAGLMTAKNYADMVISMDADLQDDVEVIDRFVRKYREGCQIVYGVRASRRTDTFFKKTTAEGFYRFMRFCGVELVFNHADYRLMSRTALDALEKFKEVNLFLRGIVPLLGFKTGTVEYERHRRFAGKSKYPLGKMMAFALQGILSFTVKPIKMITALGFLLSFASVVMLIYFLVIHFLGRTVTGWTTIVISIWFLGGLELLAIGIVGEYIGKIYLEAKERPRYIIETFLGPQNDSRPDGREK